MKNKKGRPQKKHPPVKESFDEVLGAMAKSNYKEEKEISGNRITRTEAADIQLQSEKKKI